MPAAIDIKLCAKFKFLIKQVYEVNACKISYTPLLSILLYARFKDTKL